MFCVVCSKKIVLRGEDNPTFLPVSKYWSYEDNGSIRPYCSCKCGVEDYTQKQAEKDSPPHQS